MDEGAVKKGNKSPGIRFGIPGDPIRALFLGHHRIMGQGDSARDLGTSESMKNVGILDVFPIFQTARLGKKIR